MKGFTLWFTGLSGAGKTTLSQALNERMLKRSDIKNVEILDGDVVRTNLSKGLGFSKEDRDTNIKRIGWVCALLTRNSVINMAAAISPYREIRDYVRKEVGENFVEVYMKCPIDALVERDVKGLYKKALSGEIKNFTGISDPYEEPLKPEITIASDTEKVEESVDKIMSKLEEMGLLAPEDGYSEGEGKKVEKRLESLGYI